jgi:hypothetical protein
MAEFASKGVGNAALTTGIIGTAGWALNGGLANLLGGITGGGNACKSTGSDDAALMAAVAAMVAGVNGACNGGNHDYTRYDAGKDARIAELTNALSQSNQNGVIRAAIDASTAEIIRRTGNDCPTPAYWVSPPTPVQVPYQNGCGCGCG